MAAYKIATLNVEGLHNESKRSEVFKTLIKDKYDIVALQETHCTHQVEPQWRQEWPGVSYWSKGKSTQTGIAFLFNRDLDVNIMVEDPDLEGRILRLTVQINGTLVQIVNIYGHNATKEEKSENLFSRIDGHIDPDIPPIIFGDFNMVENPMKDRRGGNPSARHTYGMKALKEIKDDYELVDAWRHMNPNKNAYTWQSRADNIRSRLDRIYIPRRYITVATRAYIKNFVWSDHDVCVVKCELPAVAKKGRGYWKLNIQYLEHNRYKQKVQNFWRECKVKKDNYQDIQMWWELGKIYLKAISIEYAQELYQIKSAEKRELLEELRVENEKPQKDKEKIDNIKDKIKKQEIENNKKIFIHTHTAVREADEEPTRYFYSLLRTRQNSATMHSILKDDGNIIIDKNEIIDEARRFYEDLYTEEEETSDEDQEFFLNQIDKGITSEQRQKLERDLTPENLLNALKEAQNEKTAGYDGLPYEFYSTFWEILKDDFLEMTKFSLYHKGEMGRSQRKSILTLIYKSKDKRRLIHWRPISLLCTDYKIITKALANNLKEVLSTILAPTQTASVPGRNIFNNTFVMRDTIHYCQMHEINAYILSIDQEKAFDKLNRDFLMRVMKRMNFGPRFMSCIQAIYKNTKGNVLINGFVSMEFDITRGVRQGCPLSALLYGIYIEVLALAIKKSKDIHGIPIPGGKTHILMQFADDMDIFLSQKTRLKHLFELLQKFQNATGSTINASKTKGLFLGAPEEDEIDEDFDKIQWKNLQGLEVLGIFFFTDFMHTQNYNWRKATNDLKEQLENLKNRKLSLKGKVLVLNSVAMSKIWYLATVIPIPKTEETAINVAISSFLWSGEHRNPISQNMTHQPREKGGLNLKDPKTQQIALQMKFLSKITDPLEDAPWIHLPRFWIGYHLAPLKPEWDFLRGNNMPKLDTPAATKGIPKDKRRPKFYDDLLYKIKTFDIGTVFWTTPFFYQELIKREYKLPTACDKKWNNMGYDPLLIWKGVHRTYAKGKHQDVHYKFLHRIIKSKCYLKRFLRINTECGSCAQAETIEHIFKDCYQAKAIWRAVDPTIEEILRPANFTRYDLILNKFPKNISIPKMQMVSTLIQIAMHTIWIHRNSVQFDKPEFRTTIEGSKQIIRDTFISILQKKFDEYMPNGMTKFRQNFCHTPTICNVQNDTELIARLL